MLVAQAHSFTQQARLAITLAWIAGYTNVVTFLTCNTNTSHVTGTVSRWGVSIVEGTWSLTIFATFLLMTFFLGALASGFCTETGRRRGWESIYVLPMAMQALLLASFAAGIELQGHQKVEAGPILYALTGLATFAMGLQNATITRISSGVVRTTHMTGVFTDLGIETAQLFFWLRDRRTNSPPLPPATLLHSVRAHPTARRLAILGSVAGSFALGAGLGALAYDKFPRLTMFPPVIFLLWIIVMDIRTPICEIESSEQAGAGDMGLPSGLAVFHLRKDRDRKGKVHRMPDLLRWSERLPADKRVVILDLGDSPHLDTNAALELREMIRQSKARGRQLVLAGVGEMQFSILRAAGAGDLLDTTNVCTDLELAIARGLNLLAETS